MKKHSDCHRVIPNGTSIVIGGFDPMSTMEYLEGVPAMVTSQGDDSELGRVVFVKLLDGSDKILPVRVQYCHERK